MVLESEKEATASLGEAVFTTDVWSTLLHGVKRTGEVAEFGESLSQNVKNYLIANEDVLPDREKELLSLGAICLQLFVQNNWTGPPTKTDPLSHFPEGFIEDVQKPSFLEGIQAELSVEGESIYSLAKHPIYLYIAKCVLKTCQECFKCCKTQDWWYMRCLVVQQHLLKERSPTLMKELMELREKVMKQDSLLGMSRSAAVEFHIEAALLCLFYFEYDKMRDHFKHAADLAELKISFVGVMGKRTKFQEKSLPQLMVVAERTNVEVSPAMSEAGEEPSRSLPKDITLQDDTLLNNIKVEEGHEISRAKLKDYEQGLVLAYCIKQKKLQPSSELKEEMSAYIDFILLEAQSWPVTTHALLLRCLLQKGSYRRIERTLAQMEELVSQYRTETEQPFDRLRMFHSSWMPPKWNIERELGHVQLTTGAAKTALELFLSLELWTDVIECYQLLGRREKAENVIREQLAIKETPDMYCYLGDVTHDVQYYEKAWELSKHRSSRAQKFWALQLFSESKTEESKEHFAESLRINPLQEQLSFTYGCACMATGDIKKAISSFRRSVNIEPDNYQGWNNLAACLIRDEQKDKAFKILNEAIKFKFDDWRLWENYMVVGTDIGNFSESIRGFHRVLDLKEGKYVDKEVLKILVRAINENLPNYKDEPSAPLRPKLQELFGRITSAVTGEAEVWRLYAKLIGHIENEENNIKVVQYLQKAQRCMTQTDEWLKDIEKSKKVAEDSVSLAEAYLEYAEKTANPAQAIQFLSAARLSLRGVDAKLRQKHKDTLGNLIKDIIEPCDKLSSKVEAIVGKIEDLKSKS